MRDVADVYSALAAGEPLQFSSTLQAPDEGRRVHVCGIDYRVLYRPASDVVELEDRDAFTCFETNTIFVRANLPPSRARVVLVWALIHAFLDASGLGSMLDAADVDSDVFARVAAPAVVAYLAANT